MVSKCGRWVLMGDNKAISVILVCYCCPFEGREGTINPLLPEIDLLYV